MKRESSFRVLEVKNDTEYIFSVESFRKIFLSFLEENKMSGTKYTKTKLYEDLADALSLSDETIKQWFKGNNGPSGIEIVKDMASFFNVDYMDFLTERGTTVMEIKAQDSRYSNEKDIVASVYEKAVDIVYFETNRFNTSKTGMNYEDSDAFYAELGKLHDDICKYIDKNSLYISERARRKLIEFLLELKNSQSGLETMNGRWIRLNPNHYKARTLFLDGELLDEEDEANFVTMIEDEIKGDVEPEYAFCVEEGNIKCWNMGFHKNSTIDDLLERAPYIRLDEVKVEFLPTPENPYGYIPHDELYRYQYMKTIIAIFREDFPEYFPG